MLALRHRPRRVFQFFDGSQGTNARQIMKGKPKAAGVAVASSGTDTTSTAHTIEATSGNAPTSPPRTLADGRRLIESAYNLAESLLGGIVFLDCCRSSLGSIQSFAFFPDEADASQLLDRWERHRRRSLMELDGAYTRLVELKREADVLFPAVWPLLNYSAAELKTFDAAGGMYRHALGFLLNWQFCRADSLYRQVRAIYSQGYFEPFDRRLRIYYENIEADVLPMELQDRLRHRLAEERSRLARDLPAYLSYISAESLAETVGKPQKKQGGRNEKTTRDPDEKAVMRIRSQYPKKPFYEIDDELNLEPGESKRIYDRVTRRERNHRSKSADKTGHN
jgi:hypothetical protein